MRRGFGLSMVSCALASGAPAEAAPDAFACQTSTMRPAEEIIVPFGDGDVPHLPPEAVRILPGETLCVTGNLDEKGGLSKLRLVERAGKNDSPAVMLELVRSRQQTLLRVHHSVAKRLYYHAAPVVTVQGIGLQRSTRPVDAHTVSYESWGPEVRQVLLWGFRFARFTPATDWPSDPASERSHRRLPDAQNRTLAATFGLSVGERRARLPELDRALVRDGFEPLPTTRVMGGLDLDFNVWRLRIGLGLWAGGATSSHRLTGVEVSTWLAEFGLTAGFDLIRYENFTLLAATGILGGNFFVDARSEGFTLFTDRIAPWEGDRVNFSHSALPLEVGVEYLAPFRRANPTEYWVFQFGTRFGWLQQLDGGWQTDQQEKSHDIGGGPSVDLSGPQYRLVLGIGLHNAQRRD